MEKKKSVFFIKFCVNFAKRITETVTIIQQVFWDQSLNCIQIFLMV